MKLLFLNQYYWPDAAASSQLLSDLAEDLAGRGHEVGVIAGTGNYVGSNSERLKHREVRAGVMVRRVSTRNRRSQSQLHRLWNYLEFIVRAGLAAMTWRWENTRTNTTSCRHSDVSTPVMVCLSTPPFLGIIGVVGKLRDWRFVNKLEDLYPDVAIALGVLPSNSWGTRFFRQLSGMLLNAADMTVVLDNSMKARLKDSGQKVAVIPNWADGDVISPDDPAGASFRKTQSLTNRVVLLYSGNFGLAHRFDALLAAAADLSVSRREVVFLFVGGGPRIGEVKDAAKKWPNVRLLPYQPQSTLSALYSAADVHLVSVRDEVAGMLVPSKYPAALAAGRAVVLLGGARTEMRDEILGRGIGWACSHRVAEIAEAVEHIVASPGRVKAAGSRARELFDEKYARQKAVLRWEQTLGEVAHARMPTIAHKPQ